MDRLWLALLRRFDREHTFRFFKQTLGWATPRLRDPTAAHRWTWLIIVAYTQLPLRRDPAADLRRPLGTTRPARPACTRPRPANFKTSPENRLSGA